MADRPATSASQGAALTDAVPLSAKKTSFLDHRAAHRAQRGLIDVALNDWAAFEASGLYSHRFMPVVEDFLEGGDVDTALTLLQGGLDRMPFSEARALQRLSDVSRWLGREGHLTDALAIMRRAADTPTPARHARYINLLYLFQIIDPAEITKLMECVTPDLDPVAMARALELILAGTGRTRGAARRIEHVLQAASMSKNKAALKPLLLMLGEHYATTHQTAALDKLIGRFADIFATMSEGLFIAPALLALAKQEGHEVPARPARAARMLHQLQTGRTALLALLENPDLRIAVVGNSPCETGKLRGAEIDRHDLVIRFNRFSLDAQYHADYGHKTDVVVQTISTFRGRHHPRLGQIMAAMEESDHRFLWKAGPPEKEANLDILEEFVECGTRLSYMDGNQYTRLNRLLGSSSSSGIQVLWSIYMARGSFKNVDTYGFSFTDQIGQDRVSSNYFRNTVPSFGNNWSGEARLLEQLKAGHVPTRLPSKMADTSASFGPRDSFRPLRFRLMGDHSDYHCGCQAVMQYLRSCLRLYGVVVEDDSYDILVVNGEGSMHRNRPNHIAKFEAMRAALDAGKRAMLVNTVWQDNDDRFDDVLRRLSFISARDLRSQQALIQGHGVEAQMFLDCSYWASIRNPVHQVDLSGKIAITDFYSREFNNFVQITSGPLVRNATYISMKDFDWAGLVHSLRSADLLVTGRHHAFFAACRAEIPFVVVPGNTYKIEGVIEASGIDIPICHDPTKLQGAIRWAKANRKRYDAFFQWMRAQPKLTLPGHTLFRGPDSAAQTTPQ